MRLSVLKLVADLKNADRALCLRDVILTFLRRVVGEHFLQLSCCDEENIIRKNFCDVVIADGHVLLRLAEHAVNRTDHGLQSFHGAVFLADDLLPVPLVDVDGVNVVGDLVAADGTHVSVQTLADGEAVFLQSKALPFRQRLNNLGLASLLLQYIEGNRTLYAVQVVVQTRGRVHKQRSGYAKKIQTLCEKILKEILHNFDGNLCFMQVQGRFITLRDS